MKGDCAYPTIVYAGKHRDLLGLRAARPSVAYGGKNAFVSIAEDVGLYHERVACDRAGRETAAVDLDIHTLDRHTAPGKFLQL